MRETRKMSYYSRLGLAARKAVEGGERGRRKKMRPKTLRRRMRTAECLKQREGQQALPLR
jgi:hypothetical protein